MPVAVGKIVKRHNANCSLFSWLYNMHNSNLLGAICKWATGFGKLISVDACKSHKIHRKVVKKIGHTGGNQTWMILFSIWHYLFDTNQWSRDHKLANLFYQFDRYGQLSILFIHFVLFIPFINVWHVLTWSNMPRFISYAKLFWCCQLWLVMSLPMSFTLYSRFV